MGFIYTLECLSASTKCSGDMNYESRLFVFKDIASRRRLGI